MARWSACTGSEVEIASGEAKYKCDNGSLFIYQVINDDIICLHLQLKTVSIKLSIDIDIYFDTQSFSMKRKICNKYIYKVVHGTWQLVSFSPHLG